MGFLIEDTIESAKVRSMVPISQSTFEGPGLITMAGDELLLKLVSDVIGTREDFFLATLTRNIASQVDRYGLPERAIGNTVNAIYFVDPAGAERKLDRVDADRREQFAGATGDPEKFYFEGDEIVVLPKPSSTRGTLVFQYFRKPSRPVATSSCGKITAISDLDGTTTVTIDTDLTATLPIGSLVDFVSTKSPYLIWAQDVAVTAITSAPNQLQVATASIVDQAGGLEPKVGDYVCPAGLSNIIMLPEEFHPVLAQMVAVRLLAALGDLNKWNAAKAELRELRMEAMKLIKNRAQAAPVRISNRNGLLNAFRRP